MFFLRLTIIVHHLLSPWRPMFDSKPVHVGFVVDKVVQGEVFLRVLRFSLGSIFPPKLHILTNLLPTFNTHSN